MHVNPEWITLVFAFNAAIAAMAGPLVSTRIARTQFKTNVLSVNRQKWIETMRDLVASLTAQLLTTAAIRHTVEEPTGSVIAQDPELFRRVETLLRTISKIELMLNPLQQQHEQLNGLMHDAIAQLRSPSSKETTEECIEAMSRDIIKVSREILKYEWMRVKRAE